MSQGKEQPETLALPKPGAMRKTVGLSHGCCEGMPLDSNATKEVGDAIA